MTYEAFKEQIISSLRGHFPKEASISIQQFQHNNQVALDGLTVLEPGSNVSPTIYLNRYYGEYQKGTPVSEIENRILRYYYSHSTVQNIDISFFTSFDNVRSRIAYKLVHFGRNQELLEEVPHVPFLDLAVVFYCLVQEGPYKNGMILIRNEHLRYWGIEAGALFPLARANTPLLLPFTCNSLAELLLPALDDEMLEECNLSRESLQSGAVPMYVVSNRQRQNGAASLLYQEEMEQVSQKLGGSFYILPSSVHEVIAIPASAAKSPQELSRIVKEINLAEVSPEEVLSDCVYLYDQDSGGLSVC
ncbi:MAG: hypothetical protein HFH38_14975 [Lachnospiraceae bacterium]|jgi:hypothetical protein|nr:hypothetical protein [Lachnospiraceae bacterium]